jgi:nitrite reductase/ring-hydroxylating ferredoxin subunit
MAVCEVCHNDYDRAFRITMGPSTHVFDSFECAIHALAPRCSHCGCAIIGHGMETEGRIFCCAHCAMESGVIGMRDRI